MQPVFAAGVDVGKDLPWGSGSIASTFPSFGTLITLVLRNSLTVIGVLLLVILIYGGLQFIISAGADDPKKTAASKALITDAVIGFVVVFLAYTIIRIIEAVTGLNILNSNL